MEMQNQIKEYVAQYEKEVRKLADQLRNECMPQPTECPQAACPHRYTPAPR